MKTMTTDVKQRQVNSSSSKVRLALIGVGVVGSMLIASPATAASACKGLENSACNSSSSCTWVDGYQRKDGRTVKSFCRSKSTTKKAAKKSSLSK